MWKLNNMTFIYKNNIGKGIILVVWNVDSIRKADAIFKKKIGKDVTKLPYIGCEIK